MPNIQMSYTANLPAQDTLEAFALSIHHLVAPVIVTDVANFKTFFNQVTGYTAGAGNTKKAFLQIDFRMLPGRTAEVKKEAADIILGQAAKYFSVANGVETQITVEIGTLDKENYHKIMVNS